ncbi:hypothetical protein C2845_PM11G30230 [Panicum miliaceum]|uniref:CRIB domain-containing protein n=1 Tax=Panicum miliaceum TaxID=4540 RepID=A0A3L6RMS5_PANMI|nr:hypothetical protein C2845_PM11G30230 [Panicum miliaceum]
MQIGGPTDVRHVSHVTFDRFVGFLGLPADLEPDVPRPVPSASVSVFGVSPTSMQCSYDRRGNSVPTILLTMQRKLYSLGGLQMADPLTALIHAVQVMNFLKTLILKTVNEREEAATVARAFPSSSGSPSDKDDPQTLEHLDMPSICSSQRNADSPIIDGAKLDQFLFRVEEALHHETQDSTGGAKNHGGSRGNEKSNGEMSPSDTDLSSQNEFNNNNEEGLFDRFKFRKGVGRLCRHPVFQFSRSMKKRNEAEQACV